MLTIWTFALSDGILRSKRAGNHQHATSKRLCCFHRDDSILFWVKRNKLDHVVTLGSGSLSKLWSVPSRYTDFNNGLGGATAWLKEMMVMLWGRVFDNDGDWSQNHATVSLHRPWLSMKPRDQRKVVSWPAVTLVHLLSTKEPASLIEETL